MKIIAAVSLLVCGISTVIYICGMHFALSIAVTAGTVAYHFCSRLAVGGIVDSVMKNRADHTKAVYRTHPWEEKLYSRLRVASWKSYMPTYDEDAFSLKRHTPEEIVGATCQSEMVHRICAGISFIPILFAIPFGELFVFIITSVAGALFDITFVIIQRYNRPRLLRLIERKNRNKTEK